MNNNESQKIELLQALINKLCDDAITPEEIQKLQDLVLTDRSMRRHYVRMMHLHASIPSMLTTIIKYQNEDDAESASILSEAILKSQLIRDQKERDANEKRKNQFDDRNSTRLSDAISPKQKRSYLVIPKIVAYGTIAALFTLVLSIFWMTNQQVTSNITEHTVSELKPIQVGTLLSQNNALWQGKNTPINNGDQIFDSLITLARGRATIQFNNQTTITLKAPVTLKPQNGNTVKLVQGSLVGECDTPKSKGFMVLTPSAQIKDLGTIFGVSVSSIGTDEVHVFKGKVELQTGKGQHKNNSEGTIRQGSAISIDHDSYKSTPVQIDSLHFGSIAPKKILLNRNLMRNGNFELKPYGIAQGHSYVTNVQIPFWDDNSYATTTSYTQAYNADTAGWPNPKSIAASMNPGNAYYVGSKNSVISQTINLKDLTEVFKNQEIQYDFSAYVGGFGTDNDTLRISLIFNDQNYRKITATTLDPVTPATRNNKTILQPRQKIGVVPSGTRSMTVILDSKLRSGTLADNFADNITLVLSKKNKQIKKPDNIPKQ